ncbi:AzlD domain-containing protein [Peterkaempfera sp. SMS 1(5)a]|uniref:AzlD domain-containing protein n=1 Tax=Peterkaempfera podocarpi TaxID=3232308 RepID=UPI00366E3EEF
MTVWLAVGATAVGCYLLKLLGLSVPTGLLDRPVVRRFAALAPVALLAALTALQTLGRQHGQGLQLDVRAAGLAAAAAAVLLRAPFLVVVGSAVLVTALVRALAG